MLDPPSGQRRSRQFTLRSLFLFFAWIAMPLTLVHYLLYGSEFSGAIAANAAVILAVVVAFAVLIFSPLLILVGVAYRWTRRDGVDTFGGLILRVVATTAVLCAVLSFLCAVTQIARK